MMEQAWLYPQGRKLPKEFNEPVPDAIRDEYVGVGQSFHVQTVCIKDALCKNMNNFQFEFY